MALYYLKAHMGQYYFFHEKMLHGKIKNRESLSKYLAKGHIDYTYNLTLETKKDLAISATQTLVKFLFLDMIIFPLQTLKNMKHVWKWFKVFSKRSARCEVFYYEKMHQTWKRPL